MQGNVIIKAGVAAVGLLFAVVMMSSIVTGGNALANTWYFLTLGGGVIAMMRPKPMVFVLIVLSGYLDLTKRLLLFFGSATLYDLTWILGFPLVAMVGVCVGCVVPLILGSKKPRKMDMMLIFLSTVIVGLLSVALALKGGAGLGTLANIGNAAAYITFIFVIPILFRTPEELRQLIKVILWTYIPVMFYTYYHGIYGMNQWEIAYLESGLTSEVRHLSDLGGKVIRPHSTLNSPNNVSVMMTTLGVMALMPLRGRMTPSIGRCIVMIAFFVAAYFTVARGGWVCGFVAFVGLFLFRNRLLTTLSYAGGLLLIAVVIAFSHTSMIKTTLYDVEYTLGKKFGSSDRFERAVTSGTFNDRLESFTNLKSQGDLWTPFGWGLSGRGGNPRDLYMIHDGITQTLVDFGYVPLIGGFFFGCYVLYRAHVFVFSLPRGSLSYRLAVLCLALILGIGVGMLANPSQLQSYPVNFFFYLYAGIFVSLFAFHKVQMRERQFAKKQGREIGRGDVSSVAGVASSPQRG